MNEIVAIPASTGSCQQCWNFFPALLLVWDYNAGGVRWWCLGCVRKVSPHDAV